LRGDRSSHLLIAALEIAGLDLRGKRVNLVLPDLWNLAELRDKLPLVTGADAPFAAPDCASLTRLVPVFSTAGICGSILISVFPPAETPKLSSRIFIGRE
jgi:hypothetical protein